jgi:hypothetical protein
MNPLSFRFSTSGISNFSKLFEISKLFEKMICNEITLTIYSSSRFKRGRSTFTNWVEFSNFVIDKTEHGHQVDGLYKAFSKAFDQVNHGLLCFDLMRSFSGMRLAWFWSYMTGRSQSVSNFGPLFFINNVDEVF